MENGEKSVADRWNESAACQPEALKTDLCESQSNNITGDDKIGKDALTSLPDVRTHHPTSTLEDGLNGVKLLLSTHHVQPCQTGSS